MASSGSSYCGVCSRNLDDEILSDGEFMIQCDVCQIWYHGKCVELEEYEAADIDNYHCPSCLPRDGPSKPKRVCNDHRYDYSDAYAADKPAESGTKRFVQELKKRKFPDASNAIVVMENGHDLSGAYLEQNTFRTPILVENPAGLGLVVPPSTFTADDVEKHVGGDRYVDVIDVYSQHSYKMRLRTFLNFFHQQHRPKLYNMISLEFSDTELSKSVKTPDIVEELSWVEQYWPKPLRDDLSTSQKAVLNEHIAARPEVSKFCLIGMAESYTDFHIDFGGTSVFYHVLWGEKVFYLIEPSAKNLQLFEDWQRSPNSSEQFFGDLVSICYSLVLKPGQTFFIPTGWIHAVYTPSDSLVVGGNFLHSFNIGLQIRIYEMEKSVNTADKFMFPHFELANWYAGIHFLDVLKELNEERTPAKPYLLEGLKALAAAMKTWIQRSQGHMRKSKVSGQIIIETMTCSQVLKQLERTIRSNEKLSAPPKPKKKKQPDVPVKIDQLSKEALSAARVGSIKVALPLPKLKLSSSRNFERSKGCPKSPAKLQHHADEVINAVAMLPPSDGNMVDIGGPPKKKGRMRKIASSSNDKERYEKSTSSILEQTSDASSRGADYDSAPPTPGWSEDNEESSNRFIRSVNNIERKEKTPVRSSEEEQEQPTHTNAHSILPIRTSSESNNVDVPGKKIFGFSLLDIPKSPSPVKDMISPPIGSPPHEVSMLPSFKTEPRSGQGKSSYNGIQSLSSHGRAHKPNQRIIGKHSRAEFFPDLGYCRQDDEFVYPSLSDSEPGDANPMKRARKRSGVGTSSVSEAMLKIKPGAMKSKLSLSDMQQKKSKVRSDPSIIMDAANDKQVAEVVVQTSKTSTAAATTKVKKPQKGTTKQRLAKALKIRKLIPM